MGEYYDNYIKAKERLAKAKANLKSGTGTEEDVKKVILGPNQRVEIESFIDPSRYAAGWARGWIF